MLRAIFEEEPSSRRRLWTLRERPEYERPFEEEHPLVTIVIPVYSRVTTLMTRSLPSVLAQTYANLEVLIVGDAASPDVEAAVATVEDPRVRFINLGVRGDYPLDPFAGHLLAGTAPFNEGLRVAQGQWIGPNCDDDEFSRDHVELLLAAARKRRLEYVYGDMQWVDPENDGRRMSTFPPRSEYYGWQSGLMHRSLREFPLELVVFGEAGDWTWLRRMLRIGVRVGMIDDVIVNYYPPGRWEAAALDSDRAER